MVSKDVGAEKVVPKRKLPKSIPLHAQGLNCGTCVYELENHVGEEGLNSNWSPKLRPEKKTFFCKFL